MKKISIVLIAILCLNPGAAFADHVRIKEGTEVLLKLVTPLRSGEAKVGQAIEFIVEKPVVDNSGITLIEEHEAAYGKVTVSSGAGMFGKSGKLDFTVDSVAGYTGVNIPLRATLEQTGDGNEGLAVVGFLFVTIFAALIRGANVSVPAGTLFTAYVDKTTVLSEDMELRQNMPYIEGSSEVDQQLNDLFKQMTEKENLD